MRMYLKTNRFHQFDTLEIKESYFSQFDLPNHFHDTYCIGLLSQGIKKSTIDGTSQFIHSNSVSIINPFQIHADKNTDDQGCLFKMIYLNQNVLQYFVKKLGIKTTDDFLFSNNLITDAALISAVETLFASTHEESLLEQNLDNLIRCLINPNYLDAKNSDSFTSDNAIEDCIEKAKTNFSDKICIDTMATESRLSKFQFIRNFKKKTGVTPAAYILIQRINVAKKLLQSHFPIGQIALEIGFYDHAQFCKFFKYFTNMTPSDYKKHCNIIQA